MRTGGLFNHREVENFFVPEHLGYLRAVLNSTGQSFYAVDTEGHTTLCNQAFLEMLGFDHEAEIIGQKLHGKIHHSHPDGQAYAVEDCPIYCCASAGMPAHVEDELFFRRDGSALPVTYDVYPIIIDGQLAGAICNIIDTTQQRAEKQLLEESERRYRSLFNYLESGFCIIEMKFDAEGRGMDYRFVETNPAFVEQTGLDNVLGKWVRNVIPEHEQYWFDLYGTVAKTGKSIHSEYESKALGRWYDVNAYRTDDMAAGRVAVLFTDITSRKKIEARDEMLSAELHHRIKNNMAMTQAIIRQTLRTTTDIKVAQQVIDHRLVALARAQDMLTQGGWASSSLHDLIETSISVHADAAHRFRIEGPPVSINAQAAMSLALVLHELGTNATKYGALSTPAGHVDILWSVGEPDGAADGTVPFTLDWRECGGPVVEPPTRRGFGSKLIETSLASALHGQAAIEFRPDGVVCHVTGRIEAHPK